MIAWRANVGRALAVITFVATFVFSYGPGALRMSLWPALFTAAASAFTVWLSGVRPVAALVAMVIVTVLLAAINTTFDALTLVIVLVGFQASMRSDLRLRVLVPAVFGALTMNDLWLRHSRHLGFTDPTIVYPALLTALSVGLGLQSRQVRRQHAELVALQDADRRRAVSDERRRIAGDLHDVAAHHLTALIVRNRLARRQGTVDALEQAADFTAQTAAEALDALRSVVHVLAVDAASPVSPQPTLADIDAVVQRMAAAGLHVEQTTVALPAASREVEVAAVRIAQEALVNVLRHRGPGRAWLAIGHRGDALELTIDDDGPSTWHAEMSDAAWHRPGSHGLVVMRERAAACGGEIVLGPSPHGGWRVSALLPAGGR